MKPIKISERVRYYRHLLNISREELANEQMSTNLIKYIECGNKNLTLRKAVVLADTINKIATDKNIELFVTAKDLLETEEECAQRFCWEELKRLESEGFDEEKYNSILQIAHMYDVKEIIIEIYDKIATNYFINGKYEISMVLLQKTLDMCDTSSNTKHIVKALNTLGSCYCMLNDDVTALEYYKKSYDKFFEFSMDDKKLESKILYNLALCNKRISKYEDTIAYIDKLLLINGYEKTAFINGMILKANILLERQQYEEALNMYKSISEYGPNYLYIVHHNMAIAFIRLNKTEESIEYLTKSISAQVNYQSNFLTISLIDMGVLYKNEGLLRPAIVFFEHTVDSAIKFNQFDELMESIDNLFELYRKVGTPQYFRQVYTKLENYCEAVTLNANQMNRVKKYIHQSNIV